MSAATVLVSRRLTGAVAFDMDDLEIICDLLGLDLVALMTAAQASRKTPAG